MQNKPKINQPNMEMKSRLGFDRKFPPEFAPDLKRENPETSDFETKNTSRTLVEFQNKNSSMPEWRLQLKNAVMQRTNSTGTSAESNSFQRSIEMADSPSMRRRNLATSGANALKVEEVVESTVAVDSNANPKLAAALKRIEKSRKRFLKVEETEPPTCEANASPSNSVLYFTAKPNDHLPVSSHVNRFETFATAVTSLKTNDEKLDTNKLPALPKAAQISSSFSQSPIISELIEGNFGDAEIEDEAIIPIVDDGVEIEAAEVDEIELQEIDDCAPLAMRFNSGLFDLIIGSFVSLLLLVPFMSFGGQWFGIAGILAFTATTAIVMFIYLTTAVALYGRTFGMKLFSLEIIDIEGEEYPTVHQAAVSSCIYLISFACAGIGFVTLFFNDEGRAAHDIVSQTIVVKEF